MKLFKYFISFCLLPITLSVSAYDAVGHRIIADIAYQNLTEKARAQLDNILGKHGIIYEATWADEIRSDKKYDYSYQWHYQNLKDSLSTANIKKLLDQPKLEGFMHWI
jgi:hypothetical protein